MTRLADIEDRAFRAAHMPTGALRCACGECRELDRAHPAEGFQLRLLSSAQPEGEPGSPARHSHPDAPAVAPAGVSETPGPPKSRRALAASTDRSTSPMTDTETLEKPRAAKKAAKAAPETVVHGIIPTAIATVRLGDLRRAPENVRHTHADDGIEELADDITAHGLLQSLIGYRDGETVQVVGGGRRYQALRELANRFLITLDFPVPVLIRDREEAVELSLSENLARRDMNPADEFVAFATLMAPGTRSPADLAKRFGFTERYVKQRLKLANLAPEILDTLRAGDMTLEAALAYGRAADQDVQRKVFKAQSKRAYDKHGADRIKYAVDSENKTTDWPLYRFVGAAAYEREGGSYEDADLFGDTDPDKAAPRRIVDGDTVIRLAHEHIDFQMLRRLPELAAELDLDAAQLTGFVTLPDLEFGAYSMLYNMSIDKLSPDGYAWVGNDYNPDRVERMLKTIRNNRTLAQIPVGIDQQGALVRFAKGFFVPKDQKNAIDPPAASAHSAPARSPAEIEADRRRDAIQRIAWRRGIGKFAGTPLEGRAFYPSQNRWIDAIEEPRDPEQRGKGKLVTIQIFVTSEEAEAQLQEAEWDYEAELVAAAERAARAERERVEREAVLEKREAELRDSTPPAVVLIDGDAWARDEQGGYSVIGDEEDSFFDSWGDLLDYFDTGAIGETFTDRAAYDTRASGHEDAENPDANDGDAAAAELEEVSA